MHHSLHFETVQSCTPKILISASHNFWWFWLQGWGFWLKFSCHGLEPVSQTQPLPLPIFSGSTYLHPFIFTSLTTPYAPLAISRPVSSTSWSCSSRKLIRRSAIFVKKLRRLRRRCLSAIKHSFKLRMRQASPTLHRKWVGQTQRLQQQKPITFEIQKIDV